MAILQKSLEEPLLSKAQAKVLRAIAQAGQLAEAKRILIQLGNISYGDSDSFERSGRSEIPNLTKYLDAEISRVLHSVKVPNVDYVSEGSLQVESK